MQPHTPLFNTSLKKAKLIFPTKYASLYFSGACPLENLRLELFDFDGHISLLSYIHCHEIYSLNFDSGCIISVSVNTFENRDHQSYF